MQTFLPYSNFQRSAHVLDRQRLGKQRVEVLQLLRALCDGGGWSNHPAANMWRGYEQALAQYGLSVCREWIYRGYKDTCFEKIEAYATEYDPAMPPWLGNADFHRSHRSNLLRKNPAHYREFFSDVPDDLPYVWPTN